MKTGTIVLALAVATGGSALHPQQPLIPFDKIQRESAPQLREIAITELSGTPIAEGYSSSTAPAVSAAPATSTTLAVSPTPAGVMAYRRVSAPRIPPVLDHKFFLVNAAHLGMALADVGMTQHCIADHRCKEGNPLMPSSLSGQFSVSLGMFAFTTTESYWLKKHRVRSWWTPPAVGAITHVIGVASGISR